MPHMPFLFIFILFSFFFFFFFFFCQGMKFLIGSKVIPETPKDIASFFLHTEGLNKKHIGEYLGGS